jgi:hypothetical protein
MFNEPDNIEKDRFFVEFERIIEDSKHKGVELTPEEQSAIRKKIEEMNMPGHISHDS